MTRLVTWNTQGYRATVFDLLRRRGAAAIDVLCVQEAGSYPTYVWGAAGAPALGTTGCYQLNIGGAQFWLIAQFGVTPHEKKIFIFVRDTAWNLLDPGGHPLNAVPVPALDYGRLDLNQACCLAIGNNGVRALGHTRVGGAHHAHVTRIKTRPLCWVKLGDLIVYNMHSPSIGHGTANQRHLHCALNAEILDRCRLHAGAIAGAPHVMLVGDFNTDPTEHGFWWYHPAPAIPAAPPQPPPPAGNPFFGYQLFRSNRGSHQNGALLDYLITNHPGGTAVEQWARVPADSDHFPTAAFTF